MLYIYMLYFHGVTNSIVYTAPLPIMGTLITYY